MPGRRSRAPRDLPLGPARRPVEPSALLRAALEHSFEAVALLDATGAITYASPGATRLLGYSAEALVGTHAFGFVHPDDITGAQQLFVRLLEQPGTPVAAEVRCRHKDGSYRRVEAVGVNRLSDPAVGAIVANYRDATEERSAQEALQAAHERLQRSEATFAKAQEIAQLGSWEIDLVDPADMDRNPLRWSDEVYRIFGHAPGVFPPSNEAFYRAVPPDDRPRIEEAMRRFLDANEPYRIEHRVVRPDGSERIVQEHAVLERDPAGRPLRVVGTVLDITERTHAEEALRLSEERYRSLVDGVRDMIFALSPIGDITALNPAFEAITGFPTTEWVGRPFEALIHAEDVPLALELFGRVLRGEARPTNEFRIRTAAGQYRVGEFSVSAQHRQGRLVGILGIGRDVTERLSLEQQLRQAQKMEAVGRLAGGIAHDFNNILTAITGHADLLLQDLGASDPRREDVEEIRRSGERAASLTRQLLAFSRQQVLQPKVVDLNALVMDMDKLLRRLIGEDIELATVLDPALGRVRADPGQLEQVIANLAVNARDAMPQGGKLTLETRNVDLDQGYAVRHSMVQPGPYALLAVSDTGIGMDAETQSHIFEPFFTTKPRGQGTGLGLATVYGIVKQSGGFIWVYSEPAHGATFKIYVPRVDAPAESAAAAPAAASADVPGGSETILLAEDEPAVRAVARQGLERRGYTVLVASSGSEALALAQQLGATINLLVTDVVMPGMSGRDLAERLAAQRPGVRVLYISGYTDNAIVRHGILDPGLAYLQKPFHPDALARKVREVLDG
jgi:two-component system, cell cycle sensor histidine kinase and response regulator CckA